MHTKKGFTLMETLAVLVLFPIIVILALNVLVKAGNYLDSSIAYEKETIEESKLFFDIQENIDHAYRVLHPVEDLVIIEDENHITRYAFKVGEFVYVDEQSSNYLVTSIQEINELIAIFYQVKNNEHCILLKVGTYEANFI